MCLVQSATMLSDDFESDPNFEGNFKSCFARSVVVNSQLLQTKGRKGQVARDGSVADGGRDGPTTSTPLPTKRVSFFYSLKISFVF